MFAFARPYTPDLPPGCAASAARRRPTTPTATTPRTMPVFNAFDFVDDPAGGRLDPKAPAERGSSPYLSPGNLRRCPGAATRAPADGSAPFVDSGPAAERRLRPVPAPGGGP